MRLFLDISCAVIILVTVIICWKKGFINLILGAMKAITSFVMVVLFGEKLANLISRLFLNTRITAFIEDRLTVIVNSALSETSQTLADLNIDALLSSLPEWVVYLLSKIDVDIPSLSQDLQMSEGTQAFVQKISEKISVPLTHAVSSALSYTAIFIVSMLVFSLLALLFKNVKKVPVLGTIDSIAGIAWGCVIAAFLVAAYTVLAYFVLNLVESSYVGFDFHTAYEQTFLFKRIFEFNLFRVIFGI